MNRYISLILLIAMSAVFCSGCGVKSDTPIIGKVLGLESDEIFQIGDTICSDTEMKLALLDEANTYREDFGGSVDWSVYVDSDTTLESYIKSRTRDDMTLRYAIAEMAVDQEIELSEDEWSEVSKKASDYYSGLTESELDYTEAELSDVETVIGKYTLADKIYESVTSDIAATVTEEEARVIEVQYIRISTENKTAKQIKKIFDEVRSLVEGGYQTFLREAKQYSEDSTYTLTIKKNEASGTYQTEAFNLNTDDISENIQDGSDYYLVYCVNSYKKNATEKNREDIIEEKKYSYFEEIYNNFVDSTEIDFNTSAYGSLSLPEGDDFYSTGLFD